MAWRSAYCYKPRLSRRHRGKYLSLDAELLVARYKEPTMRRAPWSPGPRTANVRRDPAATSPATRSSDRLRTLQSVFREPLWADFSTASTTLCRTTASSNVALDRQYARKRNR